MTIDRTILVIVKEEKKKKTEKRKSRHSMEDSERVNDVRMRSVKRMNEDIRTML